MNGERPMSGRQVDTDTRYDVVVIGAGIYGAAHAWEAASRGLSVVLLEQADFGGATSANSLKTIHGGIRYLQSLNVRRVLESKRERDAYLRVAPHLVQPMACIMPSYAWTAKGRVATAIGASLYNLLSAYDDIVSPHDKRGLRAGLVSKTRLRSYLPHARMKGINGGIRWYDGQVYDTERLVLDFVLSAAQRGAHVCNYMRAKDLVVSDNRISGVVVEDLLDDREFTVKGQFVVDTTGPWYGRNQRAWRLAATGRQALAKAVNLVYASSGSARAFGMKLDSKDGTADQSERLLFAAPWRGRVIIGTWYFPVTDPGNDQGLTPEQYEICTADAQRMCGSVDGSDPPSLLHIGLVPVEGDFSMGEYPRLTEQSDFVDHGAHGGVDRLISVCGVKYTTARAAAEKTIDAVAERLGDCPSSTTSGQPLYGGHTGDYDEFCRVKLDQYGALIEPQVLKNLLRSYGSSIDRLMGYAERDASLCELITGTTECIKAQIVYAVRDEFAQRLTDVVVRRIGVGGLGRPGDATIACCADVMAAETVWSPEQKAMHVREVEDYYSTRCDEI